MSNVLQREVLVLNKGGIPVGVTTVEKAIRQVCKFHQDGKTPKARIIHPEDFQHFEWKDWAELVPTEGSDVIRGGRHRVMVPEIIVLTKYDKLHRHETNFSRRALMRRDNYQCQYCGDMPGSEELSLDHVMPKSRGGRTNWENVVCACVDCNSKKANRTPEEAGMKLQCKPSKPNLPISRRSVRRYKSWQTFLDAAYWEVT